MWRNRKWVLENDLSEAVWRTIVRGHVPHRWCGLVHQGTILQPRRRRVQEGPAVDWRHTISKTDTGVPQPPLVRLSPDERVAEARARVVRLEAAFQVLGEEKLSRSRKHS